MRVSSRTRNIRCFNPRESSGARRSPAARYLAPTGERNQHSEHHPKFAPRRLQTVILTFCFVSANSESVSQSLLPKPRDEVNDAPDGTLFLDEPDFDPISGLVRLNWYRSGPWYSGEKHAEWLCYTPTQVVGSLAGGWR